MPATTLQPLARPTPVVSPIPPPAPSPRYPVPSESIPARIIAADFLSTAALALNLVLKAYITANSSSPSEHPAPAGPGAELPPATPGAPSSDTPIPHPPSHTTACRAASLIYRIARFQSPPAGRAPRPAAHQSNHPVAPTAVAQAPHHAPTSDAEARARRTTLHPAPPIPTHHPVAPHAHSEPAPLRKPESPATITAATPHHVPSPPPSFPDIPADVQAVLDSVTEEELAQYAHIPDSEFFAMAKSAADQLLAKESLDHSTNLPEEVLAALAALASGPAP